MYGIAMDLGTSGFRGQAVDLARGEVLGTVITARHPLPGANVMDHLNFTIDMGLDAAHQVIISAVNQVIKALQVPLDQVQRLTVCGNPIQLSLFEEIEIRDLAYAGEKKKKALGVVAPNRDGKIVKAGRISGLAVPPGVDVFIPPAVKHEIGADALAMMVISGLLEKDEISLVTDYGTNAEMALKVGEQIFTGSCAAGPALEGQHIKNGMLAAPGAIVDVSPAGKSYGTYVLGSDMAVAAGDTVDYTTGEVLQKGSRDAVGITGTGVIAIIYEGMKAGLIDLPRIRTHDAVMKLGKDICFYEPDLVEAGKAIGALRAGYLTLAGEAGIEVRDIQCAYMAGASGTYVNALKAYSIGMVPPGVKKIYQIGNTSLALAREIVINPLRLEEMQNLANRLRARHCMFGLSKDFTNAYLLELSYWGEGMPLEKYRQLAKAFKLPYLPEVNGKPEVMRLVQRDISIIGPCGLQVIEKVGVEKTARFEKCTGCGVCVDECPEKALEIIQESFGFGVKLKPDRCNGTACLRCERKCPEGACMIRIFFS